MAIQLKRISTTPTDEQLSSLLDGQALVNLSTGDMYVGGCDKKVGQELVEQFETKHNLENGTGKGSLVQKRLKSDGITWTTAKAYQGAGAALGGGTQAGMTFEEWKNDNPTGTQEDYDKSYSFAFAANEDNKALARGSAAFGRYNKTANPGEFVCGNYSKEDRNPETVFLVGGGVNSERRHNAFEVRTEHKGASDISRAFIGEKQVATEEYVNNAAVHKEGTPYVLYGNDTTDTPAVIPYRFQKDSIINPEYTIMFQPMYNGRLYTRNPEDDYHAANKLYVDTADGTLGTRIDEEAHARQNADAALGTRIDEEASTRITQDQSLTESINAETAARETAINALIGSGIQGTGNPPLQGYNKDTGTIESRLKSAESAASYFHQSYKRSFGPDSPYSNSIKIRIDNTETNALFCVMIAILDRSSNKWLNCCMTIGEGKPATGYFIIKETISGNSFKTVSCTYSNYEYILTGPSDEVSSGSFKYDLIRAAVLRIS